MTVYAIGDIHGQLDLLLKAQSHVEADRAREGTREAPLVVVGDLVDRGPDSKGVIDHLLAETESDRRVVVLKGNHDALFADYLAEDPSRWRQSPFLTGNMGGAETLRSYGVDPTGRPRAVHAAARAAIPEAHVAFLERLSLFHAVEECFLVHAGIRPGVPLEAQAARDLLWIRDSFLGDTRDHGALIVHGHTPVSRVEHHGNRLAIDTGAAWGGEVSAVAIEGRNAYLLTDAGRVPVPRIS